MSPKKEIIKKYWECRSFKDIKLKKPIEVDIIKEKDGDCILSVSELNIWAYGKKLLDVQSELEDDLFYLYESLFLKKLNLHPSAEKIKENFKKYLYATKKED